MIFLLVFLLSSVVVNAVCTLTFSESEYYYGETVVAEMICSSSAETSKAYTLTWTDELANVLETDTGTTPATQSTLFVESYSIPSNSTISNITATLTGTNLEGTDTSSVTSAPNTTIILTNFVATPGGKKLGEIASIKFDVLNGDNKTVNNALCEASISDSISGVPIATSLPESTYNGEVHLEIQYTKQSGFEEGRSYLSTISCICIDNTDQRCFNSDLVTLGNRVGTAQGVANVDRWLDSVVTLTDKSSYTLEDEYIDVCVELNNSNDFRIPVDIFYSFRCGGGNNATDRVLIDTHREYRGISGNTTQNQCARLEIKNVPEIQNKVNNCYASTDVGVIFDGFESFPVTYSTTSSSFTITSDSNIYIDGDNIKVQGGNLLAIIIGIGIMILLFILMAYANQYPFYKWFNMIMAFFQTLFLLAFLHGEYVGKDMSWLLYFNFMMFFIIGFIVFIFSLFTKSLVMMSPNSQVAEENVVEVQKFEASKFDGPAFGNRGFGDNDRR